jgi:hypothetical protein
MSFPGGGTREGPEVWSKICRRNFWPGSVRRTPARLRYTTLADMMFNEIPLREHQRVRGPSFGWRTRMPEWARSGDRLAPRPVRR